MLEQKARAGGAVDFELFCVFNWNLTPITTLKLVQVVVKLWWLLFVNEICP